MKKQTRGMILLTTMTLLSVMIFLCVSLMKMLFLFRKVTQELKDSTQANIFLERKVMRLIQQMSTEDLVRCMHSFCHTSENNQMVMFKTNQIGVFPCLQFQRGPSVWGSEHWVIDATYKNSRLVVRIAKPVLSEGCKSEPVILHSTVLNWNLYPNRAPYVKLS